MILQPGNRQTPENLTISLYDTLMQYPGPVALFRGREAVCEFMNPAFVKLLNQSGSLQLFGEQTSLQESMKLSEQINRVLDTGEAVYDYEVLIAEPGQQNHKKWFDFVYSPYRITGGEIATVLVHGYDVTQRVHSREQLAEQQLLFKNITDAAATALWMIDTHGDVVFVNQTWIDWTGKPAEAHLGRGWLECVIGHDRESVIGRFIRGLNAHEQFDVDFRIRRGDSRLQWVGATGKPRYFSDGTFAGYVGSCVDITQRKESERLLKESEQRFRRIADSAPVFIWMTDADKNSTFFNKSWLQFTGGNFEDKITKAIPDELHPDEREKVTRLINEAYENSMGFYLEFRLRRHDDVYRWLGMKFVPRYTDSNFEGYIGSGMDITEAKEHEQQKNEFIGMASHELKTPITSIKAYVQLLMSMYKNDTEDEFLQKSLSTVNKQINKLTRLITDLLDISKIESGRLSLNTEEFTLNDLLREIIDEVQHTTTRHDIVFTEHSQLRVNADRDRIAQVITNFLTNAIKYSPESDRVDVSIKSRGDEVRVSVHDYGIGIGSEERQKVFNRFYRVEGRNEQTFSGFGIGLYVAAEIIRRHNGRIWVESEKGKGSSFYFALPIVA